MRLQNKSIIRKPVCKARILTLMVTTSLMLSGCTMIPDYLVPQFSASPEWNDIPGYEIPKESGVTASSLAWNEFFQSPEMQQVIGIALYNNRDMRTALLNVDAARYLYRIERADLLPSLYGGTGGSYTRTPEDISSTGSAIKSEVYTATVGLSSYELDLFGKIRSDNISAVNEFLATNSAAEVVRNSLIAEVANAYLQYLADQKLLALTKKTLEAQQKTYDLLSQSLEKGVSTEQDVARAATAVESARVNLHQYHRYVAQDKNALVLLLGTPDFDNELIPHTTLDEIKIRENLDPGLPSEVLLGRPDIRQAEYELLARNADIGAARAAFFPSVSLTGYYGYASHGLTSLFINGVTSDYYSFAPQITVPIFQGGRLRANLDLAEVRKEQAVVNYEKTIQTAFSEVSNELAARATLDAQLAALRRLVAAAQKVYDLSDARYKSGIDSFLGVLDAQRELYTYQQAEIQTELMRLSNMVNLYRVMGGGTNIAGL